MIGTIATSHATLVANQVVNYLVRSTESDSEIPAKLETIIVSPEVKKRVVRQLRKEGRI